MKTDMMDRILRYITEMLCGRDMIVAADATRFSCSNASRHFVKRLREMGLKDGITYTNTAVRGFSKASFAVDTETKMILACDCADSNHADVKRMTFRWTILQKVHSAYPLWSPIKDTMRNMCTGRSVKDFTQRP
jgi:hypothetical protein